MNQPTPSPTGVSLNIKDLLRGGGGPDDGNYAIQESEFTKFDYRGRGPLTTTLMLRLQNDYGRAFEQHYSVGDAGRYGFHGKGLLTVPPNRSNFGILMTALGNAGFPQEKLTTGDIGMLPGLYARWENVSLARSGETRSILVPMVIHHLPGMGDLSRIVSIADKMPDEFSRPELAWRVLKMCSGDEAEALYTAVMDGECDVTMEQHGYQVTPTMIRRTQPN